MYHVELSPSPLRPVTVTRPPQGHADLVQIAQGVAIGLDEAGFAIGNRARLTECSHYWLCRVELVPGHVREEMMLNLIVQPAKPEVCQGVRSDISGREDLLAESTQCIGALQHKHPLMVGREDGAHIQAEQHLMYQDEDRALPHAEERDHDTQVKADVDGHTKRLENGKPRSRGQQKPEAVDADGKALKQ